MLLVPSLLVRALGHAAILLCTMVQNENDYLVEWIEFHKLQQFQNIRIYDDANGNATATYFLQAMYGDLHMHNIETVPWFRRTQTEAFQNCSQHAEETGAYDWVAIHDVDEFWFSPSFRSVGMYAAYMMNHMKNVSQVHVHQIRYGTNGHTQPVKWPKLLIEEEVMRGPSKHLKEELAQQAIVQGPLKEACKDRGGWWICEGDLDYKSMWRTRRGCVGWIHGANGCSGEEIYAHPNMLRGSHYYLRSVQDAKLKSAKWNKPDPNEMIEYGADKLFETVHESAMLRWVHALRKRIKKVYAGGTG
jgi:hypothetical protein